MLFQFVKIVSTECFSEVIEADSFEEAWEKRNDIEYCEGDTLYEMSEVRIANNEDDLCDNVIYCEYGSPDENEVNELIDELNNEE
jgi:hypothetical protein